MTKRCIGHITVSERDECPMCSPQGPRETKERLYRAVLVDIRTRLRSDPKDFETAVGDLRSIYDAANNALMENGDGFTSPRCLCDRADCIKCYPPGLSEKDTTHERYKQALQRANGFLIMHNLEPVKLEYSPENGNGDL